MNQTFPATHRIKRPSHFRRVFACRRYRPFFSKLVVAHYYPTQEPAARIGLVCSKKKVKRAVDRNRLKRLARETFRRSCSALPKCDIVLVFLKQATQAENAEIVQCLEQQFSRLKKQLG